MAITKIVQQISPALALSATIYQDNGQPPLNGNIDYWLPLLKAQSGQLETIFSNVGGKKFITFDMGGNAHDWNLSIVTFVDGDSVSNALPWEYVFEMTDGNGNLVPRLWNDNQALHQYDNGNSTVNTFAIASTTGTPGVGALNGYAFVLPKRQASFAADYSLSFKGAANGALASAVVDPSNAANWLVTINFTNVFVSSTDVSDPTSFGTGVFVFATTVGTVLAGNILFATQPHGSATGAAMTEFKGSNVLATATTAFEAAQNFITNNSGNPTTPFVATFKVPKTNASFAADWSLVGISCAFSGAAEVADGANWDVTVTVTPNDVFAIVQLLAAA